MKIIIIKKNSVDRWHSRRRERGENVGKQLRTAGYRKFHWCASPPRIYVCKQGVAAQNSAEPPPSPPLLSPDWPVSPGALQEVAVPGPNSPAAPRNSLLSYVSLDVETKTWRQAVSGLWTWMKPCGVVPRTLDFSGPRWVWPGQRGSRAPWSQASLHAEEPIFSVWGQEDASKLWRKRRERRRRKQRETSLEQWDVCG